MKKTTETKSTPYVNAFDGQVWLGLWTSMIILTFLCIIEEMLIKNTRCTFGLIMENVIIMVQTLLQESTKDR